MKICAKCRIEKPLEEYHLQPSGPKGRHSYCKPCASAYYRGNRKHNYSTEQKRRWSLKTRYGMTPADVEAMKDGQGGLCGICDRTLGRFHIDHSHANGQVRGLLCHRCNIAIGGWDDPEFRIRALSWLDRG